MVILLLSRVSFAIFLTIIIHLFNNNLLKNLIFAEYLFLPDVVAKYK